MIEPVLQNPPAPPLPRIWTHKEGVEIAARWLRNRCKVILPEFVCMNSREIADVIGFNANDSHMIEVKVSRADFLSDKKKYFRRMEEYGMGNYRYYCCPRKLIGPLEVPDGWGLIYIFENGKARIMMHPDRKKSNQKAEIGVLYSYARRAVVKGLHDEIMKPIPRPEDML